MLETDIRNLNSHFKQRLSFIQILLFIKSFYFDKNDLILSLFKLKENTNCSFFEIIKIFYFPSNLQMLVLNYSFPKNCQTLFLQIVKDSITKDNFSNTFSLTLNKLERLELSFFYNKKFYN